jgi:hypothetical protein
MIITTDLRALPNTPEMKKNLLGLNSLDKMKPNGVFEVRVLKGDRWQDTGSLAFDRFFRERTIDISAYTDKTQKIGSCRQKAETVRLKLIQKGGGAAHIDSVLLGGKPPVEVKELQGATTLKKLSQKDYDVVGVSGESLELSFQVSGEDRILRLVARVEGTTISKTPFQFPRENLYRPMALQSSFYRYWINSEKGFLKIDGNLDEVVLDKPFFSEYSQTGSGHPSGFTYGWVRNDNEHLYVAMDFTPDNTMDGDKDYVKVFAKTADGLKEFKVSTPETSWGSPGFTYTDKVAYQHKVYEFKIPLKELGVTADGSQEIPLAFAAYGTAGPGDSYPELAYDPSNNRYLLVYTNVDVALTYYHLLGQLLNSDGTTNGAPFPICNNDGAYAWMPSVAYDNVNQRFLVAWQDNRNGTTDIYGQLVNADGSLYGTASNVNFVISNESHHQQEPSAAYDSANQRFLVAWQDNRSGNNDIYGQLVNDDASLYGALSDVNFVISNAANQQYGPSVTYDSANQRFLVAWQDNRNGTTDIYGQLVNDDGSLYGALSDVNFVISNAANQQYGPSVTYDSTNQRFFVAFGDNRNTNSDIYGQLVNDDGSLYITASNANFVISNATNDQQYPLVAYDSSNQRFLVAWQDNRNGNNDIYGQLVNANRTLFKTASDINFPINNDLFQQSNFSLASNSGCRNFLVSYDTWNAGLSDVGTVLVGYPCTTKVKVLSPNGGEILAPMSSHVIEWAAPANAVTFKIKYSLDKGITWKSINCSDCHGGSPGPITTTDHEWFVPVVTSNKKNCLMKVIGYNAKNVLVGSDKSDATFIIEVMKLTYPNGWEPLRSGDLIDIAWTVNSTKKDVTNMVLSYTTNGGTTWKPIETLTSGPYLPGSYTRRWEVPPVPAGTPRTKCKVKVVLKDEVGNPLGSDTSDGYFTITLP